MLKLKQVIIRKIESKFKDSKYVADIVKINDETGCGGLHGYTDIKPLMNIVIGSISIFG